MQQNKYLLVVIVLSVLLIFLVIAKEHEDITYNENLYDLLGIQKDASVKEIRKAFKTLAVTLHPDKNKDDEEAHSKFLKLTHAYEILKDPETRKSYDIYGDTGEFKGGQTQYKSYNYYAHDFGLYDDDPLIVTLSKADYELNVLDKNQAWWVNFYSPQCHHCHTLAPTWRKLAADLEGVFRIAAVNCEEDWVLCHQLGIKSYPTLLYYEKEANLDEGEAYRGVQSLENLKSFILSRVIVNIVEIGQENFDDLYLKDQWLLFLCAYSECPEEETQIKLAATLEGLLNVAVLKDDNSCKKITKDYKNNQIVMWQVLNERKTKTDQIIGSDYKEILINVLRLLPNPNLLDEEDFKEIRTKLRQEKTNPWLICFYLGQATELDLELKRLSPLIPNINIGLIHCGKSATLCKSLHISHYPTWATVKIGGAFEKHHGRDVLHDVASFARDSVKSTNLHALSPADFAKIKNEGETWFIDWYAPWCPPCRRLMPEMRRASQHFTPEQVQFGSIDCTQHSKLCANEGVRSYPSTKFYKGHSVESYHGVLDEHNIANFVDDMLNPVVIPLNSDNFIKLLRKPADEMWFVNYYSPMCGPCQRLAPNWRALAKQLQSYENIKLAEIDCVRDGELCKSQGVRSYPTLRLYPLGSKGLNAVAIYTGHREVLAMKSWIFNLLPSSVILLSEKDFKRHILESERIDRPWLVDFYSPWCSHCVDFEPNYRKVAEKLLNVTKTAKLNCDQEKLFCRQLRVVSYPTVILYLSANNWYQINTQEPEEIVSRVESLINAKKNLESKHDEL